MRHFHIVGRVENIDKTMARVVVDALSFWVEIRQSWLLDDLEVGQIVAVSGELREGGVLYATELSIIR